MSKKKLLLIGWDAADWKIINPLMDNGLMPTLNRLVNESVIGDVQTLQPALSPLLWTSIATGKTADKHGILGFIEPSDGPDNIMPITTKSRKSKAIWNILNSQGYKCNVLNWWPSHPAEPINGCMVSNYFNHYYQKNDGEWTHPLGSVFPEKYIDSLRDLIVRGQELGLEILEPFIPSIKDIYKELSENDLQLVGLLQEYLGDCISNHAQATWLMENDEWDFTAVYYETIDKICHVFMKYTAPRMENVSPDDFQRYRYVVNACYVFHDMMLERLLALVSSDTSVMLLSDHGFTGGNLRPKSIPKLHAAISIHHDPLGIFLMKGKGVKKDERIFGVGLLDIVPTILTHLNLPVGDDMDGKVLIQCFDQHKEVKRIPSWEKVQADFGEHKSDKTHKDLSSKESNIMLNQLASLGYINLEDNSDEQGSQAMFDLQYHLSVVYRTSYRFDEALELLELLYQKDRVDARISMDLIEVYNHLNRPEKARVVLERFKKYNVEKQVDFKMIEVQILMIEKNTAAALEILEDLIKSSPDNIKYLMESAHGNRIIKNYDKALKSYSRILELNQFESKSLHGKGICYLKQEEFDKAISMLLEAIGIQFDSPVCHFHLAEALMGLELYEEAANALESALHLNPGINRARSTIIDLYENKLGKQETAELHRKVYESNIRKGEIIVVSGLPRSGTSLMMQMLQAGGIELMTDGERTADESNPNGYFELEKVKSISRNNAWIEQASGKAVKVISPLLKHLKLKYKYKIIHMERDLNEILMSQYRMTERMHGIEKKNKPSFNLGLSEAYKSELKKVDDIQNRVNVSLLRVSYKILMENAAEEVEKISQFLTMDLDQAKMKAVIDPTLYREKSKEISIL